MLSQPRGKTLVKVRVAWEAGVSKLKGRGPCLTHHVSPIIRGQLSKGAAMRQTNGDSGENGPNSPGKLISRVLRKSWTQQVTKAGLLCYSWEYQSLITVPQNPPSLSDIRLASVHMSSMLFGSFLPERNRASGTPTSLEGKEVEERAP